MTNREIKKECYKEILNDAIDSVETIVSQLGDIESEFGVFDIEILQKDRQRTFYDLELALATLSLMLRKMDENQFIDIPVETRADINSIIHSNRFEYHNNNLIYCYSQKGKEDISINQLLRYAKAVI